MRIAFCYENVLPHGGCATYIADLSRRLVVDGHEVHLYACRWDSSGGPGCHSASSTARSPGAAMASSVAVRREL